MRDPKFVKHKGWWNLVFTHPDTGRRKWMSLGTRSKKDAERIRRRVLRRIDEDGLDPFVGRIRVQDVTVKDAATMFAGRTDLSPKTVTDVVYLIRQMAELLPAGMAVEMVETADLETVLGRCRTPHSRESYRLRLNQFFKWAKEEGLVRRNPVERVRRDRNATKKTPRFLSREEFERLVEAAGDGLWRDLIEFAVGSGLRRAELVNLRFGDVDDRFVYVRESGRGRTKTGERTVPLSPLARRALRRRAEVYPSRRIDENEIVFAYSASHASKTVRRIMTAAGLAEEYHLHTLRDTFASWARMRGVEITTIAAWLGHRSIVTTMRYAHLPTKYSTGEIERVFEEFDDEIDDWDGDDQRTSGGEEIGGGFVIGPDGGEGSFDRLFE